ncbi:MAG: tetratricopeptide repeat protein [Bacteroidia bacterium]|nr:tetratricopeptide repeat protein [Bacteroidia bacterium]
MKRLFVTLFIAFVFCNHGYGQTPKMDSLKMVAMELPPDSTRLKVLMEISTALYRVNQDSAIKYSEQARDLAQELGRMEDLGYALKNIGLAYYFKSNFPEVMTNWQQSLEAFESIDHTEGISNLLNNLGAVAYSKGDDPKALEYYLGSLRAAEKINNEERMATAYVNIGAVYANDGNTYREALENYAKALAISERTGKKDAIGTTALNIGELYLNQGNADQALLQFQKSLSVLQEIGGHVSTAFASLGRGHAEKGEYLTAIEYYNKAIAEAEKNEATIEESGAYTNLGDAYRNLNQNRQAVNAYLKGIDLAKDLEAYKEIKDGYEGLAKAYASLGDFPKAYEAQTKFDETKEVIRAEEYDTNIGNLRFQFDLENKQKEIAILNQENEIANAEIERASITRNFLFAIAGLFLLIIGGIMYQLRFVKKTSAIIEEERNKSEEILLNILPKETADELKLNGFVETKKYDQATVLFTDFKGFTLIAEKLPAEELIKSVDFYFKKFDEIIERNNLEKIKTIGDAYMCAGGLPEPNDTNQIDAINAALEIVGFVNEQHRNPKEGIYPFEIRVGLNTGPVVAGVVGTKKFQYDIWGNTVNVASRMESNSEPGKVNISEATYALIKDYYKCKYRGEIDVKNAGKHKMYFIEEAKPKLSVA